MSIQSQLEIDDQASHWIMKDVLSQKKQEKDLARSKEI
jgi:hypothetical protein